MASYTTNYGLYKPNRNDEVIVDESLTENFETVDTEIKNRQDAITDNASNISSLQETTSGHANDINTLQTNVSNNSSDISSLQTNVSGNSTDINNLQDDVSDHANSISGLQDSIGNAENSIDTLNENVGTMSELTTTDQSSLVNAINEVNVTSDKGIFTASGDGAATTVDIPHGLSDAPAFYQVQEGSADAGAADISHVTVDATNITVTFKTAPVSGTDNVSLVWRAEL